MTKFGAARGKKILEALEEAANRGVKLRILTAKQTPADELLETTSSPTSCSSLPSEVQMLADAGKEKVDVRCWSGPEWYGSGILHQKIWVFDSQHVYVGSANMDWKSLAQVMEVGVVMENLQPTSPVIQDMQRLFDAWWLFASPELLPAKTATYFSEDFQHEMQVPSWSLYLPESKRTPDPFVAAGLSSLGNISHQFPVAFSTRSTQKSLNEDEDISSGAAQMFVAAAPLEATAAHSRAFDEDALVYTIRSAKSFVSLSVMDFAPFSMYTPGPLHWPALTDALLAGVYGKPGLQNTTSTSTSKATWPSYTRVNHAKYIVTDARANIGTSNMEWGYFYTTAGASVNTNHEPTRKALEEIFERNWNSSYALPLDEVIASVEP
ncbi:hypothetical protein BBJ29_002363 [Phytophthora kernoviae]|uniref:PLD phosphodiesterase domain-containing protein n=1 Tax=Phytophthora kernoviae TaxID=325452 RepID=A0A3F2RRE9_9STRA|nr:hypothetical protein BBJ29_002363 [Phytophthora kernoviae]RLN62778.1 hypothetical protein BBP00_00004545 [Phytophthora kernoviae]